jgi:hypothetical protein
MSNESNEQPTVDLCHATRGDGAATDETPRADEPELSAGARAEQQTLERLRPAADLLSAAMSATWAGELDPRIGSVLASLAGALVRVSEAAELEARLLAVERYIAACKDASDPTKGREL